ncbi:MAG: hypothetical protein HY516_01805 [Candidatus Aenigmarchaeota archaeon]|nr:hypothetical protein [Candidatus Aenigmarchaeota archaeon]
MVELLISSSLVTAFIAGIAALFAPCCISVLLPAYLGSIFRQRRTVFLMTFVFFLGLLLVFLPLGFGIAGVGQFFSGYHNQIFIAGGLFVSLLGISILAGKHFSLPFSVNVGGVKANNAGSVFVLGIFSGFATLCCAPVLAGVLALSVLPGSVFWGGVYSFTYVLGMVAPLFVIAYYIDKKDVTGLFMKARKQVSYSVLGNKMKITIANLLSGVTFLLMGLLILFLASTNRLAMGGGEYQTTINIFLARVTNLITQYAGQIPVAVWLAMIAGAALLILKMAVGRRG